MKRLRILTIALSILAACPTITEAAPLKLHAIFTDHMVLQRDKPIKVWGWADDGDKVSVQFGKEKAEATAAGEAGRWEVTFPAREASTAPMAVTASTGGEKVALKDVLIGDG